MARMPTVTSPSSSPARVTTAIGIDVGGTKVAAAVVTSDGAVVDRRQIATPSSRDTGIVDAVAELVAKLRVDHGGPDAVGIGVAGLVEWPAGTLVYGANHDYERMRLRALVRAALERDGLAAVPVVVDNDANAAAWAEAARSGVRDLLFVTVGTGVGSGMIVDGQLMRGRRGLGAELGHLLVQPGGPRCTCGKVGCLEVAASARALAARCARIAVERPDGLLARQAHGRPVTAREAVEAARAGDPDVLGVVREMSKWLAVGIDSAMSLFNFEEVVFGGGLAALGDLLVEPIRRRLDRHTQIGRHLLPPRVRLSAYGADAGLVGAALLALDPAAQRQVSAHDAGRHSGEPLLTAAAR